MPLSNIKDTLQLIRFLGFRESWQRFAYRLFQRRNRNAKRLSAQNETTYSKGESASVAQFFNAPTSIDPSHLPPEEVFDHWLNHCFDFLGSGWTEVSYKTQARGFLGHIYPRDIQFQSLLHLIDRTATPTNKPRQHEVASMISANYRPIDWQLDFKSGYRWSEETWFNDITFGDREGVDVKVPWELGRMQWLPLLALKYRESLDERYAVEVIGCMVDFIASNPPEFGVQWAGGIDTAIRVCNWLLTLDILSEAAEKRLDSTLAVVANSIEDHRRIISENLEWSAGKRTSHYFAQVVALLWIAIYQDRTQEVEKWTREFEKEILSQFNREGGNFEASLPYHHHVVDFLPLTITLLLAFRKKGNATVQNPLGEEVLDRLSQIYNFSSAILSERGDTPQIGDNDNGRFTKLDIRYRECNGTIQENLREYWHVVSSLGTALGESFPSDSSSLEAQIVLSTVGTTAGKWSPSVSRKKQSQITTVDSITYTHFEESGYLRVRSLAYDVVIRAGNVGQSGKGGHAHNDVGSICLSVGGEEFIVDAGAGCYTASAQHRNHFRSTSSHNVVELEGREQNDFLDSRQTLFWMKEKANAAMTRQGNEVVITHAGFGMKVQRSFTFFEDRLLIVDSLKDCPGKKTLRLHIHPDSRCLVKGDHAVSMQRGHSLVSIESSLPLEIQSSLYSPSYGIITPSEVVVASQFGEDFRTTIFFQQSTSST